MDVVDTISRLQLDDLSTQWVRSVITSNFCAERERPAELDLLYDEFDVADVFNELCQYIKEWLTDDDINLVPLAEAEPNQSGSRMSSDNQRDNKNWHSLILRGVNNKALIVLLSSYVKLNYKELTSFPEIKQAFSAARLYFMLCSIDGSKVFSVYNSILYGQMVESLKLCYLFHSQKKGKKKKKRGKGKADTSQLDDEGDVPSEFMSDDIPQFIRIVSETLDALSFFLDHFSFSKEVDAYTLTVQALVQVTRVEREKSDILDGNAREGSLTYLAQTAYKLLFRLLSENQFNVHKGVGIVLRYFLPILNVGDHEGLLIDPAELTVIKNHSLKFFEELIEKEPDASHYWLKRIIQQLVVRLPEKAELRSRGIPIITDVINLLPYNAFYFTSIWILSYVSNSPTVKHRLSLLEVVNKLLNSEEKVVNESCGPLVEKEPPSDPDEAIVDPVQSFLDLSAASASRVGNSEDPEGEKENTPAKKNVEKEAETNDDQESLASDSIVSDCPEGTSNVNTSLYECFVGLLFYKFTDVSPTVKAKALTIITQCLESKKSVIQRIVRRIFVDPYSGFRVIDKVIPNENSIFPMGKLFSKQNCTVKLPSHPLPGGTKVMETIECLICDDKVYVRKNALQLMTTLFILNPKWMTQRRIKILFKACRDQSVVVRKILVQLFFDLIVKYPEHESLHKCWVEGLLPLMADNETSLLDKLVEGFEKIILLKMKKYSSKRSPLEDLPWRLLNLISKLGKRSIFRFTVRHWCDHSKITDNTINIIKSHIGTENNLSAWMLLVCISEVVDIKAPFVIDYFNENILDASEMNEYSSVLVTEALYLNWRVFDPEKKEELYLRLKENIEKYNVPICLIARAFDICHTQDPVGVKEWSKSIIQRCEAYIQRQISPGCKEVVDDEETLCLCIFTLSEAILITPEVVKLETVENISKLIDPEEVGNYTVKEKWKGLVSDRVKSEAVTFIGKASIQDIFIAKSVAPVLAMLLSIRELSPSVKINTLIALSDMCVKFTSVVENHIGQMTLTLKDEHLQVRSTCLYIFLQLLQEDYLKIKDPSVFYFFMMLDDPDRNIREKVKSFFINSALVKIPGLMSKYAVHAIYFFNDYDGGSFSKQEIGPEEKVLFSLKGPAHKKTRRMIYSFMLEHMPDDHKFRTAYRICSELLSLVCEGSIPLDESSNFLIEDALYMLACEDMRLNQLKGKDTANDEENGDVNEADVLSNVMRKALISSIVKRNYIENIVPVLVRLRRMFMDKKSPLLRDLMICFRELMKEFKNEINDVLGTDKELAEEVAHDLKDVESEDIENMGIDNESMAEMINEVRAECEILTKSIVGRNDATSLVSSFLTGFQEGGGVGGGFSSPSTPSPIVKSSKGDSQSSSSNETSKRKPCLRRSSLSPIVPDIVPKIEKVTPESAPSETSRSSQSGSGSRSGRVGRQRNKKPLVDSGNLPDSTPVRGKRTCTGTTKNISKKS